MNRPTGVTVLAVLDFIGAGLEVLAALALFVGGAFIGTILGGMAGRSGGGAAGAGAGLLVGGVLGVFCLAFAVLSGIVGYGMWNLKDWARMVQIVFAGIGGFFQAIGLLRSLMHFRIGGILWNLIWLGVNAWIIFYLIQPTVKAAFAQPPQMQAASGD